MLSFLTVQNLRLASPGLDIAADDGATAAIGQGTVVLVVDSAAVVVEVYAMGDASRFIRRIERDLGQVADVIGDE
jgi:hypothetical protein